MSNGLYPALDAKDLPASALHVAPGVTGVVTLVNGAISAGATSAAFNNVGYIKQNVIINGVKTACGIPMVLLDET